MCGIAGILGPLPDAERGAALVRMTDAIRHRGPDDQGHFVGPSVGLGMRRLSIIDLEGGHQPMRRDDGIGIVFNGEIYNYRALQETLKRDGYSFRTHSDTETLLHLYHRDGLEGLRALEGMFAFALYDPGQQAVHLVRDRFGVKPLYVARSGGRLYFASEIKAILAAVEARPGIDLEAVNHYLTLRYVPGPGTVWKGIRKLPPGSLLTFDLREGTENERRWWNLHYCSEPLDPSRDYLAEFESLFLPAVEKRLLAADVPVGVLLSGGLDSSAVAMAAALRGHRSLHTFSVAFREGGLYDETGYARLVADQVGSVHHEVRIGVEEFVGFLPEFVRYADEPLADLASVPLYYVCRLARQHVKAVLSGEGSDEVFAGYHLEQAAGRFERLRRLERVAPRLFLRLAGRFVPGPKGEALRALGADGLGGYLGARATHNTLEWSTAEKRALWRQPPPGVPTEERIRAWYGESVSADPLDQTQDVLIATWLVEDLLMKADKMSMATSLEAREPFLDHRLVEWAARLPTAWRVGDRGSGWVSKRILREFCGRHLPREILTRPKQGFPVPAYRWLSGPLAAWSRERLTGTESRVSGLFHDGPIRRALDDAGRGDTAGARRTWALLILEEWLRCWT
jgi:asparagine synthase (glutamine-hydrolysing)